MLLNAMSERYRFEYEGEAAERGQALDELLTTVVAAVEAWKVPIGRAEKHRLSSLDAEAIVLTEPLRAAVASDAPAAAVVDVLSRHRLTSSGSDDVTKIDEVLTAKAGAKEREKVEAVLRHVGMKSDSHLKRSEDGWSTGYDGWVRIEEKAATRTCSPKRPSPQAFRPAGQPIPKRWSSSYFRSVFLMNRLGTWPSGCGTCECFRSHESSSFVRARDSDDGQLDRHGRMARGS